MDKKAVEEKRKDKIPYDYYKDTLKNYNPQEIVKNTGCKYDEDKKEFTVKIMGQDYIVKYPLGEVLNGDYSEIEKYPTKTLILRYLINAKGVAPINHDITYRDVPGGEVYYNNFYGRCILRLIRTFGKDLDKFRKAFQNIPKEEVHMGDIAYKFQFINNVYVTFALWEGDDEFPPSAQILFDKNAAFYFTAEDLAVVGDVSIGILTKLAYAK
ncbi:DUF3786 domain-containing protein [Clostridium sp. KNHs214]|uniref:DUF3786 domain-containing protein n=1 Tax=Clostridium sp. KNHs214 TaxID=1540257 RepID=UPI000550512A|nr:DUF3786 domain-containing protein [Clostridium sp. KNHs214]